MTPKQRALYDAVCRSWVESGHGPSLDEICAALAMRSKGSVKTIVDSLVHDGYLERAPGRARALRPGPRRPFDAADLADLAELGGPAETGALAAAARRLLDNLVAEDIGADRATVRARDLGDLDIALAELAPAPADGPGAPHPGGRAA